MRGWWVTIVKKKKMVKYFGSNKRDAIDFAEMLVDAESGTKVELVYDEWYGTSGHGSEYSVVVNGDDDDDDDCL